MDIHESNAPYVPEVNTFDYSEYFENKIITKVSVLLPATGR